MKINISFRYLKRIIIWLFWVGRYYLLSLLAIVIAILYITRVFAFYANIVSFIMVILGLLLLFTQQILDAKEFSDQKPNTPRNWFATFPTSKPITLNVSSTLSFHTSLKAHVIVSIPENEPIEKKVEILSRKFENIENQIITIDENLEKAEVSLNKSINDLKTEVNNLNLTLTKLIGAHAVGAFDLNFFGIVVTFCGTIIQYFS